MTLAAPKSGKITDGGSREDKREEREKRCRKKGRQRRKEVKKASRGRAEIQKEGEKGMINWQTKRRSKKKKNRKI